MHTGEPLLQVQWEALSQGGKWWSRTPSNLLWPPCMHKWAHSPHTHTNQKSHRHVGISLSTVTYNMNLKGCIVQESRRNVFPSQQIECTLQKPLRHLLILFTLWSLCPAATAHSNYPRCRCMWWLFVLCVSDFCCPPQHVCPSLPAVNNVCFLDRCESRRTYRFEDRDSLVNNSLKYKELSRGLFACFWVFWASASWCISNSSLLTNSLSIYYTPVIVNNYTQRFKK